MDELVLSSVYFIDPLETLVEYIGSPAAVKLGHVDEED
jgi:hypothetical protein